MYFLALAKLAARFFLWILAFRSRVPLRARYLTGIMVETLGSERNRLPKSKKKKKKNSRDCLMNRGSVGVTLTKHFFKGK